MRKNLFQDMVKVKRINRKTEDVPARIDRRPDKSPLKIDRPDNSSLKKNLAINASYDAFGAQGKNRTRYMLWVVAGASLVFLFFAVAYVFS